jgi:hypothetical protein
VNENLNKRYPNAYINAWHRQLAISVALDKIEWSIEAYLGIQWPTGLRYNTNTSNERRFF